MKHKDYKQFVRDVQDSLDEDDSVFQIAKDIIDTNEEVREYLVGYLGESDPVARLENDLY